MSNMASLERQLSESERQSQVNRHALASITSEHRKQEARGYAVMSAFLGYGEGAVGNGVFGKISHAAKLFCIAFAFLAPSLLIWQVLL